MKVRASFIGYFIQRMFMESFTFFQEWDLKDEDTCSLTSNTSASRRGEHVRPRPFPQPHTDAGWPRGRRGRGSPGQTDFGGLPWFCKCRAEFLFIDLCMYFSQRKGKLVSVSVCEALQEHKVTGGWAEGRGAR